MHSPDCREDLDVIENRCTLVIPEVNKEDEGTYIMESADIVVEEEKKIKNGTDLTLTAKGADGDVECRWIYTSGTQICCYQADPEYNPGICDENDKKKNNRKCRGGESSTRKYPEVTTNGDTCSMVLENVQSGDVGEYFGHQPHDTSEPQANYSITYSANITVYVLFHECPDFSTPYFGRFVTFLVLFLVFLLATVVLLFLAGCLFRKQQKENPSPNPVNHVNLRLLPAVQENGGTAPKAAPAGANGGASSNPPAPANSVNTSL